MVSLLSPARLPDRVLAVTSEPSALPDLPSGLKFGAGARVGRRLYAGLGSMGKRWLVLDLDAPIREWRDLPEFPGVARDQAVAVAIGRAIHVYGGAGSPRVSEPLQVLDDAYQFDTATDTWRRHGGRIPAGQLGAAAVAASDGRVLFFGGVHKPLFDRFLAEQAASQSAEHRAELTLQYLGKSARDYRFARAILCHEPESQRWSVLEGSLDPAVAGAAVAVDGEVVTLISGEIKPGVRTPLVQVGRIEPARVSWGPVVSLPRTADGVPQEGLAGAMCGFSQGALLCAGGTNFPGAAARFMRGELHAHRGLQKQWQTSITARVDDEWHLVGHLDQGRAHGLAFEFDGRLWLVGGETDGGAARVDTVSLRCSLGQVPVESGEN